MPGIPAARRSSARCSTCCQEASTSSQGSSRAIIPAFPDGSRNVCTYAFRRPASFCRAAASGSSFRTMRCAADRSFPNVSAPAVPASAASAVAASSADRIWVSSSMIRRCTGCSEPAYSAARHRGSRAATEVA